MVKRAIIAAFLGCLYLAVVVSVADHMKDRPVVVKLGYTPNAEVLKVVSGEHRLAVAEFNFLKVLFYFGTLIEKWSDGVSVAPEYENMYRTVETVVQLDPYNIDAYYFAEAAFTWEVGHARDVNRMLDYGMKYRTWDWYLPFFAGFNAAYFLGDYASAATYMQRAAEISGNSLFTNLAARYFYESGQTDFGVRFLDQMIEQAKDPKFKRLYEVRREALVAVRLIQKAVDEFRTQNGRLPVTLDELVSTGFLSEVPRDPYQGQFLIGGDGVVRSTSHFALPRQTYPDTPTLDKSISSGIDDHEGN